MTHPHYFCSRKPSFSYPRKLNLDRVSKDAKGSLAWADELLPLTILLSPILRLRYRVAVSTCVDQINAACQQIILTTPRQAENLLAVEIESGKIEPPPGVVYVKDSDNRYEKTGQVHFFTSNNYALCAAIITLPEDESSPYTTLSVTLHEFCQLFGVPDIAALIALYRSNNL